MPLPRFTRSLHFRISALFLGLMALFAVGYYFWIDNTVFKTDSVPGQDTWYDRIGKTEIDSLARLLPVHLPIPADLDSILVDYGDRVRRYQAEISLLDADGAIVASSRPDSLSRVLVRVSPALLDSMGLKQWDFESFPNPYDVDAFENRIFAVAKVRAAGDADTARPAGYLVGSFRPVSIQAGEIERTTRHLALQAAAVILLFAAISGMILMAWVSRRIAALSVGLAAFREGDFTRRVPDRSADELGRLSRDFNAMADHLAELIGQLRQSEEFQRQLLGNLSHDLRTPLASLRGYVETLELRGDTLPAAQRNRCLAVLRSNVAILERLVGRMLELSRLDAGQAEFRVEDFSLPELCHEVIARCETIAAERHVALRCDLPAELAPVRADPLRIGQVLQNLIENGIKFNRAGGDVTVTLRPTADGVLTEVRDTGRGIAAEHLPHIFDRFYTADPSRGGPTHDSGLGLAIVSRILEGHGSRLEVESRPGEGACFRFNLPLAPDPGSAAG
jgi:signal transduction histidine kinase